MCGLSIEIDEDVLQVVEVLERVIAPSRKVHWSIGRKNIPFTVSIGGFVPKAHTSFQWWAQFGAEETDARLAKLREAIRSNKRLDILDRHALL